MLVLIRLWVRVWGMDKEVGVKDFIAGFQGLFSVADTGLKVRREFRKIVVPGSSGGLGVVGMQIGALLDRSAYQSFRF